MPLQQLRNVNFGLNRANATGPTGVGYTLLDTIGQVVVPRTTNGVYQTASDSGIYAAYITFPDDFRGQLLWDTGTVFSPKSYAAEQVNVEENNPLIYETHQTLLDTRNTIDSIYHVQFGRWQISNNQMVFYKDDNTTEIARYNLFDDRGVPSMDAVFQRIKIMQ